MIAQVRPLRPDFAAASLRHLWGVVLPPGDAPRVVIPGRRHYTGVARRGAADGRPTPLERLTRTIPVTRLVTVVTREERSAVADALDGSHRCVEPTTRGSAPELLLAAMLVLRHDPHAIIAALRADYLADPEPQLMPYVARASAAVLVRPELPIVIGADVVAIDRDAAWIEPGEPIEGLEAFDVHVVRRYLLRASAAELAAPGMLLGTRAVVMSARTLLALGRRHVPDVVESLEPLEDVLGHPEGTLLCDAVWESMPRASVSRDVLAHVESLGVVSLPDAMTREWTPSEAAALAS